MYEFIQPNERRSANFTSSIKTIFNNINLDDTIEGFQTLTITGRALVGRDITSIKIPGSDYQYVTENRLADRDITIKFLMKADSNEELRERFNNLNLAIHSKEIRKLYFTDEPYYYNVLLKGVANVEEKSNTIVASIVFKCIESYKYNLLDKTISFNNNGIFLRTAPSIESVPVAIDYRSNTNTNRIVITNDTTKKRIIINSNATTNDNFKITLEEDIILKKNNKDISKEINFIETDFDFTVKKDDFISLSPAGECQIIIKERLL